MITLPKGGHYLAQPLLNPDAARVRPAIPEKFLVA
jgi:hypothetical protein